MTPMAIGLYNDAVKFFEKNEFELAREALGESLSLEGLRFMSDGAAKALKKTKEKATKERVRARAARKSAADAAATDIAEAE